ncbi:hypothetical protein [Deinococcus multiflagellatus]|uniref:Uncharacterized protein n=1 Tax=Deinococcus multiflagellatus TaxID=1656887 RepID=A0ABW1ZTY3_9DEIO|nr:hypothetical protein [Deinococcus multiflagellatus]MBZ9714459.1 hypothetical protein [Deinococcus multiflagellatus]
MSAVHAVLARTDWLTLREQKTELVEQLERLRGDIELLKGPLHHLEDAACRKAEAGRLEGLLAWINAVQDAAEQDLFPVNWQGC